MANVLTGLIPTIYNSLNVVSRETIGFIPNVSRDATAAQAAVGAKIRSPVVPQNDLENIVAGDNPADSGDQTQEFVDLEITNSKAYPIRWSGDEQLSVTKDGVINTILGDQFQQAFRTLSNAVESDLASQYTKASRAYGAAGTTPFATPDDLTDLAEANRILDDNGAPPTGRAMILGSAARAKLEGRQPSLFKVNEEGSDGFRRSRDMRTLHGFTIGASRGVKMHAKGTGTLYDVNNGSGEGIGQTTITLDGGTAGATGIVAGDVVTFAGDSNKYIVTTGQAGASGDIVLSKPGLLTAVADATELTVGNSYTANMFFSTNALHLAARVPAMPQGGDEAEDVTEVQDPISGLTFQIAVYRQYRRVKFEVGLAWGVQMIKPEHAGILLG